MNFCSRFLRFSVFPWCKDSPQIFMLWWEWLGILNIFPNIWTVKISVQMLGKIFRNTYVAVRIEGLKKYSTNFNPIPQAEQWSLFQWTLWHLFSSPLFLRHQFQLHYRHQIPESRPMIEHQYLINLKMSLGQHRIPGETISLHWVCR